MGYSLFPDVDFSPRRDFRKQHEVEFFFEAHGQVLCGVISLGLLSCIVVPFDVFGLRVISHSNELELRFSSLRRVLGGGSPISVVSR